MSDDNERDDDDDLNVEELKKRIERVLYVLATGDLKIGYEFWGPFETDKEAWNFAVQFPNCDWIVCELKYPPTPLEDMIASGEFDEA